MDLEVPAQDQAAPLFWTFHEVITSWQKYMEEQTAYLMSQEAKKQRGARLGPTMPLKNPP